MNVLTRLCTLEFAKRMKQVATNNMTERFMSGGQDLKSYKVLHDEIAGFYEKQVEAAFTDIEHKAEMSLILNELMTIKHAMVVLMANTPIKETPNKGEVQDV
uniref:Uncharacterized protein n=1 Tax=viral metagenome TaxID=1070528 RepID=A0A6H1ZM46_9ZZZZ